MFDTKFQKIIVTVIAVFIIGGAWCYFGQRGPDLEVTECPHNVAWGTNRQDAKVLFDAIPGYTQVTSPNKVEDEMHVWIYHVDDYLGIEGLDGSVTFKFNDNEEFEWAYYKFSVSGTGNGNSQIADPKALKSLKNGLVRAHNELFYDSAADILSDGMETDYSRYWLGRESYSYLAYWENEGIQLRYEDKEAFPEMMQYFDIVE